MNNSRNKSVRCLTFVGSSRLVLINANRPLSGSEGDLSCSRDRPHTQSVRILQSKARPNIDWLLTHFLPRNNFEWPLIIMISPETHRQLRDANYFRVCFSAKPKAPRLPYEKNTHASRQTDDLFYCTIKITPEPYYTYTQIHTHSLPYVSRN